MQLKKKTMLNFCFVIKKNINKKTENCKAFPLMLLNFYLDIKTKYNNRNKYKQQDI